MMDGVQQNIKVSYLDSWRLHDVKLIEIIETIVAKREVIHLYWIWVMWGLLYRSV